MIKKTDFILKTHYFGKFSIIFSQNKCRQIVIIFFIFCHSVVEKNRAGLLF